MLCIMKNKPKETVFIFNSKRIRLQHLVNCAEWNVEDISVFLTHLIEVSLVQL